MALSIDVRGTNVLANLNLPQRHDLERRDAINISSAKVCFSIPATHAPTVAPATYRQAKLHSTLQRTTVRHHQHDRGPKILQPCCHRNQQYSIVGLTNAAGTLVERYTYTAYGTLGIYAADGTVRNSSSYNNRYTYTGREWDHDLKLYHFRARWYDPATGGFVSRDPLGFVDGMSMYRGYMGVLGVDPSGQITVKSPVSNRAGFKNDCKQQHKCGDLVQTHWHFTLTNGKSTCEGWIVQKVTVKCDLKNCEHNDDRPDFSWIEKCKPGTTVIVVVFPLLTHEKEEYVYYEAWRINVNDLEPKNPKFPGANITDSAKYQLPAEGIFTYRQVGEIRFFCDKDIKVGENVGDKGWHTPPAGGPGKFHGKLCPTTSGTLPSWSEDENNGNAPPFWDTVTSTNRGAVEVTGHRFFATSSNCCPKTEDREKPISKVSCVYGP